jgi:hypothetical protein
VINVKTYGAVGDGLKDDTQAFKQAIDSAAGEFVEVPPGRYVIESVTTDKPIKLVGSGWQASIIKSQKPDQDVFTTTSTGQCFIEKLGFISNVPRTGGAYVKFDTAQGYNFGSRISDCNFDSAFTGVNFVDAAGWVISGCYFTNYKTAVQVANKNLPDAGDSSITESIFDAGAIPGIGVLQNSSGGLRLTNNKFLNGTYHYLGEFDSASSTSILVISGNSFEWASACNMALNSRNLTTFGLVVVDGNEFSISARASGVLLQDPGYDFLNTVMIGNNVFNQSAQSTGLNLVRGKTITVSTNTFAGNGTNTTGIAFGNKIGSAYVLPQNMQGITTKYAGINSRVVFPVKP